MSCCFVSLVRLVGNRRHVADLGSIEQDHRTQRGRNGGCGVSPGDLPPSSGSPFVLPLAQTANGFDCREIRAYSEAALSFLRGRSCIRGRSSWLSIKEVNPLGLGEKLWQTACREGP